MLFFKFSFWDCGEALLRKFDHILPVSRSVERRQGGFGARQHSWEDDDEATWRHPLPFRLGSPPLFLPSLQACREKADAILFLFSFADRASFLDLPQQISRVTDGTRDVVRMVVGTKYP